MAEETATLFDGTGQPRPDAPLAARVRPRSLAELVGQQHLLEPGSPLYRLVSGPGTASGPTAGAGATVSLVLWGPPGTGKTTLAALVSAATDRRFVELSAVTAGVKDVRAVIDRARDELTVIGRGTVLFVDEVHRFSKTQQDALLPAVENGWVTLVAATTENPGFAVIAPLLSRSLVLALRPLSNDDIGAVVDRAVVDERGLAGAVGLDPAARDHLVRVSGGDARRALTALQAAADAAGADGRALVGLSDVEHAVQQAAVRYDRDGDLHYDVISAFIKSVRGSDVDAGLHYLARMLEAGEDPRFVARRLVILASEDIGMADPTALQTAVAALQAVAFVGMPEARITLAQATVHLALAPKSNAVYKAVDAAIDDVRRGRAGWVPAPLRDGSSSASRAEGAGAGYLYAHDQPQGVARQEYLPETLRGRRYYQPTQHGAEARWAQIDERLRQLRAPGASGAPGAVPPVDEAADDAGIGSQRSDPDEGREGS
ncbi:MAG: replication-associated recombination protein A [Actinomycetota bacterium]|nr:MAG: replication-associated recombination protein A [Actinomycetota bacterium]